MAPESMRQPSFENPPVVETVLAVQFDEIVGLRSPIMGLLWNQIRDHYPEFQVKPPLASIKESFERGQITETTRPEMGEEPPIRCWFLSPEKDHLLQVQNTRFLHNWRSLGKQGVYPRYSQIQPRFVSEWGVFRKFLLDYNLGEPRVNQCEVTYINHIPLRSPQGKAISISDVVRFFPKWEKAGLLSNPIATTAAMSFDMPDRQGRLHISLKEAIRHEDDLDLVVLELTARGAPAGTTEEDFLKWMDLGHDWVVNSFDEVTTPQMHSYWGRL